MDLFSKGTLMASLKKKLAKHKLAHQFFSKIGNNLSAVILGFVVAKIIPSGLGVELYGKFSYLTDVQTKLLTILDSRSSTFFFVKISKNPKASGFILFYLFYSGILLLTFIMLSLGIAISPLNSLILSNVELKVTLLSTSFVLSYWILELVTKYMDAIGRTTKFERIKLVARLVAVVLLIFIFYSGKISLTTVFLYHFVIAATPTFLILRSVFSVNFNLKISFKKYFKDLKRYISPLVIYTCLTISSLIFDRWILQHYGGDEQQGLFGFSYLLSNVIILFITSLSPLFIRELSKAIRSEESEKVKRIYDDTINFLLTGISFLSIFCVFNTTEIILILTEGKFIGAEQTLKVMFIFPLISTFTVINGAVLFSLENTKILRKISIGLVPFGVFVIIMLESGYVISSQGSLGLAMKIVVIEAIQSTITTIYIIQRLSIRVVSILRVICINVGTILLLQFMISYVVKSLISDTAAIVTLIINFVLFVASIVLIVILFPNLFKLRVTNGSF